jgi:hypothetical protein
LAQGARLAAANIATTDKAGKRLEKQDESDGITGFSEGGWLYLSTRLTRPITRAPNDS